MHIDADGRLWLCLPDGDHIAVLDARTGEEIDRKGLSCCIGAGEFVAHPGGVHLGLSVAQGQDGTQLAIRRFADDRILASCAANDVPGFELHDRPGPGEDACDATGLASWLGPSGYRPNDGADAYLDDDHVLAGVFTAAYDTDETELHLVLSARSLHWVATVGYGQYGPPRANSTVPGHDGRWLTYDWRAGAATLWEPHHFTQEAEPALFDVP